ncbi:MAG: hypothetical protein WC980_10685 [Candidatus Brocadiia bacterium]
MALIENDIIVGKKVKLVFEDIDMGEPPSGQPWFKPWKIESSGTVVRRIIKQWDVDEDERSVRIYYIVELDEPLDLGLPGMAGDLSVMADTILIAHDALDTRFPISVTNEEIIELEIKALLEDNPIKFCNIVYYVPPIDLAVLPDFIVDGGFDAKNICQVTLTVIPQK